MAFSFLRSNHPLCRFLLHRRRLRTIYGTDAEKSKRGLLHRYLPRRYTHLQRKDEAFPQRSFLPGRNIATGYSSDPPLRQQQNHCKGTAFQYPQRNHLHGNTSPYTGRRPFFRNHLPGTHQTHIRLYEGGLRPYLPGKEHDGQSCFLRSTDPKLYLQRTSRRMVYPYQGEDGKKLPAVQPSDSRPRANYRHRLWLRSALLYVVYAFRRPGYFRN